MPDLQSRAAPAPYALKSASEQERRRQMRTLAHIAPLSALRDHIFAERNTDIVPDFDPESAGVNARVLVLWETPGPDTLATGFMSPDNPDQTARSLHHLLTGAGIARQEVLSWSIVPWWVGTGIKKRVAPVPSDEWNAGLAYLSPLFALLPRLQTVVLLGKKAHPAREAVTALTPATVFDAPYPSPQVFNTLPGKRQEAREVFEEAALRLREE